MACGGLVSEDQIPGGGSPLDAGGAGHAMGGIAGWQGDGDSPVDASGGGANQDSGCVPPKGGDSACCDGKACRGTCGPDGQCYCALILGGCWEGSVCCGNGCRAPEACAY